MNNITRYSDPRNFSPRRSPRPYQDESFEGYRSRGRSPEPRNCRRPPPPLRTETYPRPPPPINYGPPKSRFEARSDRYDERSVSPTRRQYSPRASPIRSPSRTKVVYRDNKVSREDINLIKNEIRNHKQDQMASKTYTIRLMHFILVILIILFSIALRFLRDPSDLDPNLVDFQTNFNSSPKTSFFLIHFHVIWKF